MAEVRNPVTGQLEYTGPDKEKRDKAEADAAVSGRSTSEIGAGSKEKKGRRPAPKAAEFGGDMKAFGEALRKWREEQQADPEMKARQRALEKNQ